MEFSQNTDQLADLVRQEMTVEDITLGGEQQGYVMRCRGRLLDKDTSAAYDRLAEKVNPFGLTPLFRWDEGRHAVLLVTGMPKPKPSNSWINLGLFIVTFLSIVFSGGLYGMEEMPTGSGLQIVWAFIRSGLPFALSLIAILAAHEFGHYFAGRYHGVHVTLPYFIPFPFSQFGTMGAFINMKELPKNRRVLLDIFVSGAVCGFLGVYVVLRRIIFVSAALTQISSFGVALSFYLEGFTLGAMSAFIHPFVLSIVFTSLAAVFFAAKRDFSRISQEGVIGFGFLIASGAVIILGDRITKGAHDIADILFGSAVVVDPRDVYIIPAVALAALITHIVFFKDFVFVSFDEETARLFKYPVRTLNTAILITIAVVVAVATRALGALPVFAFLALPPLTSLLLTERLRPVFVISVIIGALSATLGYFFSFVLSIPTGASMTVCASVFFVLGIVWREVKIRT
jgi:zinc transport system permease protein